MLCHDSQNIERGISALKRNAVILLFAFIIISACFVISGCGGGGGASSRGIIEGYIYVPDSGRGEAATGYTALAWATIKVTVDDKEYPGTVTDSDGHFTIYNLPSGKASLQITPPTGSKFNSLTTSIDVAGGQTSNVGKVTLLSNTATGLTMSIDKIDITDWPTLSIKTTVNDPVSSISLLGLRTQNFTLTVNGSPVSLSSINMDGNDPNKKYILKANMSSSMIGTLNVQVDTSFSSKTGSATDSLVITSPSAFVSPLENMTSVVYSFKDPDYTAQYPARWFQGTDIQAAVGTRVNAVANGVVTLLIVSGDDTALVVHHRVSNSINTADGSTQDFYVLYGCITPTVGSGAILGAGQKIGTVRTNGYGSHLHLGIRVDQGMVSARPYGNLVDGKIPSADAYGLTDGWVDPITFLNANSPDPFWNPD